MPKSRVLIDIGATKTLVALEEAGSLVGWTVSSTSRHDRSALLDSIEDSVTDLSAGVRPVAIAAAVAGAVDADRRRVRRSANLPFGDYPLADDLERRFQAPALVEEDANAGALGEAHYGRGRGVDTLLYVTISSGIGMGIVSHGSTLRGAYGAAGELGHVVVDTTSRTGCTCGRKGCLESLASGLAIASNAARRARSHGTTSARAVLAAAADGTEPFATIAADAAGWIAQGLDIAAELFDPQAIVLDGGLSRSAHFVHLVRGGFIERRQGVDRPPIRLVMARLAGWSVLAGLHRLVSDPSSQASFRPPTVPPDDVEMASG